jgi:hypothetical protein
VSTFLVVIDQADTTVRTTRVMRCSSSSSSSSSYRTGHGFVAPGRPTLVCKAKRFVTTTRAAEAPGAASAGVPFVLHNPALAEESALPPGKCWLAGVGPGSWDHVTVRLCSLDTVLLLQHVPLVRQVSNAKPFGIEGPATRKQQC